MKQIRILLLCLVAVALLCLLPNNTQAATYGNLTYEVAGGEITITGYTTKPTGAVVIPDSIGGYPVTAIADSAFLSCFDITEVTIGNNVKVIGISAFDHCTNMTKLTIGSSVEVIGDYAFNYCSKLSAVTMGDSVKTIGEYAFQRCMSLQNLTIGNSVTSIGADAFTQCHGLKNVYIPDSVTYIGEEAFHYTVGLQGIWVSEGNNVYSSDDRGVLFNKEITVLIQAPGALSGSYTVPDGVVTIEAWSFFSCGNLTHVTISDTVECIEDSAFYSSGLQTVTLGDSLLDIGSGAFDCCSDLKYNTFDNGNYLGTADNPYYALVDCSSSNITSVVIHSKTKIICSAFDNCSALTSVTMPDGVISIGSRAFNYCSALTEIMVPNGVKYIGERAFFSCKNLKSLTIPNGVTTIGNYALSYCESLTKISVPASVMEIGTNTFAYCKSLTGIFVDQNNPNYCSDSAGVLFDKNKTVLIQAPCALSGTYTIPGGVTEIGGTAFYQCSGLETVHIPGSITQIGKSVFSKCSGLKTAVYCGTQKQWDVLMTGQTGDQYLVNAQLKCHGFGATSTTTTCASCGAKWGLWGSDVTWVLTPDGTLTFSGTGPMRDCYSYYSLPWYGAGVKSVVIEDGITSIGYGTFYYCSSLTQISIPDSVTSIGQYAFAECSKLTGVTLSGNITDIGAGAFQRSGIKQLTIPNGIKTIKASTFSGCYSLESVTIPASVTYIDSQAFYYCTKLTEVALPSSLTGIGSSAFCGCSSLTSLAVPGKVTSIEMGAFSECTALTGISIYGQLTTIEKDTFKNCSSLVSIYIPKTVTTIGQYAFYGCSSLPKLTIPDAVTTIGQYAFYGCSSLPKLTIPDAVTTIEKYAFYDCTGLEQISFGKSLSSIGELGFYHCTKLTELTLPDSLTYIGYRCFENCTGLETVTFGTGLKQIDEDAFCYCKALKGVYIKDLAAWCGVQFGSASYYGYKTNPLDYTPNLYLNGELIRNLVLPNGLTSVSANAFRNCTNIVNLTIPLSVTSIGENAFYNCTNLTHVLHIGSRQNYSNIVMNTGLPGVYLWCRDAQGNELYTKDVCVTREHICSICQKSLWSEPLSGGNHSWTAASCTTPKTCTVCGAVEGEALGHSGGVWFELTTPTCTETGMKARICNVCNETEVVTLDALGHSYSAVVTAPTCTKDGFTTHTCAVCGDSYQDAPVAALGHSFGDWTQTAAPTCTEAGKEQRACSTCGEMQEQDVAALGHTNTSVVTAPTCTVDGYTTNTCATCGAETITDIVAAKGHGWSAWIQTAAPSCTKEGSRVRFCNCGVRETEVLPKTHKLQNGICTSCGALESYRWVLSADADVNLELEQDLYVDLNGYDLTGTMKCNGFKVYGLDSTTNSYTCQNIGYLNCTDENGKTVIPQTHFKDAETLRRYMAIKDENGYSFHRFYLGITHMSLKPTTVGVGYKAVFYGDAMVAANLDSFGFTMRLDGNDAVTVSKAGENFVSGKTVTLRVDNFDVERHGETTLFASVMLKLSDGTVIESVSCQLTMRSLLETLNTNYATLTADQLTAVADLIKKYIIIQTWKVENLVTE